MTPSPDSITALLARADQFVALHRGEGIAVEIVAQLLDVVGALQREQRGYQHDIETNLVALRRVSAEQHAIEDELADLQSSYQREIRKRIAAEAELAAEHALNVTIAEKQMSPWRQDS